MATKYKNTQEFQIEMDKINPKLLILGEYTGIKHKILVKCKDCGNEFEAIANNLLKGHGCNKCANKKRHDLQAISHNDFLQKLNKIQPNIEVLSEYYNNQSKVEVKCKICGNQYFSFPNNLLRGYGCKQCYRNKHKSRTRDEFIECVNNITDSIVVGNDYINGKTPCTFLCKICGYQRKVVPNLFLSKGCTCPKCDGNVKLTTDEYANKVFVLNSNIEILSEYTGAQNHIECKCKICNYTWNPVADSLLRYKASCPNCQRKLSHIRRMANNEENFIDKMNSYTDTLKLLSKYTGKLNEINCYCELCGQSWSEPAVNLENRNFRCCFCQSIKSQLEYKIQNFLIENNIQYESQKKFEFLLGVNNGKLSYDFYLIDYNVLIEAQGKQHCEPVEHFGGNSQFNIQKEHDSRKREYANQHGIGLIEIWYDDLHNVENILREKIIKIA